MSKTQNCEAYTLYRTLDGDRRIVRGEGTTPKEAREAARKAGYDAVEMLIDGVPAYQDDLGRWYLAD